MKKLSLRSPLKSLLWSLPVMPVLLLTACSFSLAEDITPPPGAQQPVVQEQPTEMVGPFFPVVAPDPAVGAPIYAEKCAPCHGDRGMGDGPSASQLSVPVAAIGDPSLARQYSPSEWFKVVTQGKLESFMPPFTSLSDRQRWDVVAYVYTLSMGSDALTTESALYQENCASCHGNSGKGDGPQASSLTTPVGDYTDQARMAVKSSTELFEAISKGVPPDMPGFESAGEGTQQLSEDDRWKLASLVQRLSFANPSGVAADQAGTGETTATLNAETLTNTEVITTTNTTTMTQTGPVVIQLINGSGGEIPEGLPVNLFGFDSMQLVYTDTLPSSSSGIVQFEVPKPAGRAFLAGMDYQNTTIGSDVAVVEDPATPITLTITLFDTTTDPSSLVVDRMHVFFLIFQNPAGANC
jgi:mono/diheme cytochrome c family protein